MIISFINQKGGVGKTTLALNVAACLASKGNKILLIDADSQASATSWASYRDDMPFVVTGLARENMGKEVMRMAADYDVTIIDAPPHAREISRSCIIVSDLVIIPVEPSGLSKWASDLTVQQIQEAQEYKPTLKCGFVVSRKIGKTVIGREMREMMSDSGMPIFKTEVQSLVAFPESATMAQTIFEYAPSSQAAKEIEQLTNEIWKML